jgi:hypothetical protein
MRKARVSSAVFLVVALSLAGGSLSLRAQGSGAGAAAPNAADPDIATAISLADLVTAARTVVSLHQDLINDPGRGDKGLTPEVMLAETKETARRTTGLDMSKIDPQSRQGRLLAAMASSIAEVMKANQPRINQKGVGFKGFVPAVFGRLVTEQFGLEVDGAAEIKITAPPELVRNRKASPDPFEAEVIRDKFLSPGWKKGELYAAAVPVKGRPATRVLVPEYYGAGCLSCHGEPKGEIDITGYPKEGAKLDQLGGVISITLYK